MPPVLGITSILVRVAICAFLRSAHRASTRRPTHATTRPPRSRFAVVVRAERGTVLITQEGDPEDHVLEAGDEIILPVGGLAVAWALAEAAISVRHPALMGLDLQSPARLAG